MQDQPALGVPEGLLSGVERLDRRDRWPVLALLALAVVSNLIPAQRSFYNSDQAELAQALVDYDVGVEHPHPPGNPLFVACAKAIYMLTGNALTSLLAVTGALRVGAVVAFYWLVALLYGRRAAVAASALWVLLPSLWFTGVTTFTWAADACFTILVAATAYKALRGNAAYAVLSAALLAAGLGFRESLLLLLPLWVFCVRRHSAKTIVIAVGAAALIVLGWATGMVVATGSLQRYMDARAALMNEVVKPTTMFFSGRPLACLLANSARLSRCVLGYGSALQALVWIAPLTYAIGRVSNLALLFTDRRVPFLLLWWLPPIIFYMTAHIVHVAHILLFLPAWLVIAGVGMVIMVADLPRRDGSPLSRGAFAALLAFVLAWNGAAVLFSARPSILRSQSETDDIVDYIREHFRADSSFLVQADIRRQFRAVMYRLPDFEGTILQQTFGATARASMATPSPIELPPEVTHLVIPEAMARVYVPTKARELRPDIAVRWRALAPEERFLHFDHRGLWTSEDRNQTNPPSPAPIPSTPAVGPERR